MRMFRAASAAAALFVALATTTQAQDSVSIPGCFPGDAVSPWDDQFGAFGSEQSDTYVVDLSAVTSSWGNSFGIAPLSKSALTSPFMFFSSLMGGNGISRDTLRGQRFSAPTYSFWNQPGFGISNDPSVNTPGTPVDAKNLRGTQFAAVFAESGMTGGGANFAGIVSSIVNIDPSDPGRLYVNRIRAGTNSCDPFTNTAALGVGSIDASGNVVFRADNFGTSVGCSSVAVAGNNIFLIDSLARNTMLQNVISGTSSGFDPAMTHLINNYMFNGQPQTLSCPTIMPASISGGAPIYLGTDFSDNFVRGSTPGSIAVDGTYLDPGVTSTRGNTAYLGKNFPIVGSTHGICGILGVNNTTAFIDIWGVNASANVTGTKTLSLPSVVIDNSTLYQNVAGINEFNHYKSQVAFQGGSGCVAMNIDPSGNLLVAAEVDHPDDSLGTQWGGNYIAVCRVDAITGAESWTMAGYTDPVSGGGKPVLDGPNGAALYRMTVLPTGPSVSAPMIDASGNVYFLSFVEELGTFNASIALIKAVYDEATFSYELELVVKTGDIFTGENSQTPYLITSLRLTDSNSIASDAPWSQNISQDSFLGLESGCFAPADSRSLGGMVVAANILYDSNGDGIFEGDACQSSGSTDEEYRVLLYVGGMGASGVKSYGTGCPGFGGIQPVISWDGYPASGKDITMTVDSGIGGQSALIFLSVVGPASLPIGGPCFLNLAQPMIGPIVVPLFGAGAGNGAISIPTTLPALPPGLKLYLQAFCTDPTVGMGASATQGLEITFQP